MGSIAGKLREFGGLITIEKDLFFDLDNLEAGQKWVQEIQQALDYSDACIVFIGEHGIGKWQHREVITALNKYDEEKGEYKVIPVIIPHSNREQLRKEIPWLLSDTQWIEFIHETDPEAFQKLLDCLGHKPPPPPPSEKIPYKGLSFFDVDDAPYFFGRTFDINWIFYKKLRLESKIGNRFLAIVGDSGSGKSSFARAGLLATLKAGRFPGSENWIQVIFTPEDNPLLKLFAALEFSKIITDAKVKEDDAKTDNSTLRRVVEVYGRKMVLMIDQFEEAVTQCKDNALRDAFLKNLTVALKSQHFVCIITLRSDFYAAYSPYKEFVDRLETSNYTITNLDYNTAGEEWSRYLKAIIQYPARLLGFQFDAGLTRQIIEDCKGIHGILPALQMALMQLWKKRNQEAKKIEPANFNSLADGKGIGGIIEAHANSVWNLNVSDTSEKQSDDQKKVKSKDPGELIKAIFIRLIEITGNKEDVRKTVNKQKLIKELCLQFDEEQVERMLNILAGPEARLIKIKTVEEKGNTTFWVEVVHEVLIRQWGMLRQWLNERREAIKDKNRLEQYIEDNDTLLTGKRLVDAELWLNKNKDLTNSKINDIIEKSRASVNKKKFALGISLATTILLIILAPILYPVFKCRNCSLVENLEKGNYHADEVPKLIVKKRSHIACLQCFKNLDTLILTDVGNLSQATIDSLPQGLKQLSIKGFITIDSIWNFERFSGLKALSLDPLDISGQSLKKLNINNLDSLMELTIVDLGIDSIPEGLEKLKSLRSLHLSELNLSTLSGIKNLTNLQSLTLDHLGYLESIDDIKTLVGLQTLTLDSVPIERLPDMANFKNLQTLSLRNMRALVSLSGIENLPGLQTLSLLELLKKTNISDVEKLTTLITLDLDSLPFLPVINTFKNLKNLSLSNLHYVAGLSAINNLDSLQSLTLKNVPMLSLAGIEKLTKLQSLTLDSLESLLIQDLTSIENFSGLQNLHLSGLNHLISLKGIEKLTKLKTLHLLELNSLSDFTSIEMLKGLRSLHLSGLNHLTGLTGIENLTNLQSLTLTKLSINSLSGIENLRNLRSLYLDDVGAPNTVFIPALSHQQEIDTLIMYRLKLESLRFLDRKPTLKIFIYNDKLELLLKNGDEFSDKAREMKKTRLLNESIQ